MKIEIDDNLYSVLEARAEEKSFSDTDEYIQHLLGQVVEKIKDEKNSKNSSYSDDEEEKVKERLRDLGYLD